MSKNLIEYRYYVEDLFFKFATNKITLAELIEVLTRLDNILKTKHNQLECGLWFKFGSQDTLCTTIADLERDLQPYSKNYSFTFNRLVGTYNLNAGINDSEVFVYFS